MKLRVERGDKMVQDGIMIDGTDGIYSSERYVTKRQVYAFAKHVEQPTCHQRWASARRKVALGTLAVAMSGLLVLPNAAFAASEVWVDSTGYTRAASGTGWIWDGADDMTLDGFTGTGIAAIGDLNILLKGDNVITAPTSDMAVAVSGGDLAISGDSSDGADSLTTSSSESAAISVGNTSSGPARIISITDASVSATSTASEYGAIRADGSINIDNASVTAVWGASGTTPDATGALMADGGNISITNGSAVSATGTNAANTKTTHALYATAVAGRDSGTIRIADSTVQATATNTSNPEWARAIGSFSNVAGITPRIDIQHSNVEAHSNGLALLAWGRGNGGTGVISITDGTITSPAGAHVQDVLYHPGSGDDFRGQTLGTGTGTITALDSPDIVKDTVVTAAAIPPSPTSDESAKASGLPVTGDNTNGLATAFAALIASASALITGAFIGIRRRTQR